MVSSRSNPLAEKIIDTLTMGEVARFYGFEPNRAGFIQCPFHQGDHTASLKIYPGNRGWCCFGCHKGGSVINFVMDLFGLNFQQAVLRLNMDFHLGLSVSGRQDPAEAARYLEQKRKEREALEAYREEYRKRTALYRSYVDAIKAGEETPLYFEALKNIDALDDWFEEHEWR